MQEAGDQWSTDSDTASSETVTTSGEQGRVGRSVCARNWAPKLCYPQGQIARRTHALQFGPVGFYAAIPIMLWRMTARGMPMSSWVDGALQNICLSIDGMGPNERAEFMEADCCCPCMCLECAREAVSRESALDALQCVIDAGGDESTIGTCLQNIAAQIVSEGLRIMSREEFSEDETRELAQLFARNNEETPSQEVCDIRTLSVSPDDDVEYVPLALEEEEEVKMPAKSPANFMLCLPEEMRKVPVMALVKMVRR